MKTLIQTLLQLFTLLREKLIPVTIQPYTEEKDRIRDHGKPVLRVYYPDHDVVVNKLMTDFQLWKDESPLKENKLTTFSHIIKILSGEILSLQSGEAYIYFAYSEKATSYTEIFSYLLKEVKPTILTENSSFLERSLATSEKEAKKQNKKNRRLANRLKKYLLRWNVDLEKPFSEQIIQIQQPVKKLLS